MALGIRDLSVTFASKIMCLVLTIGTQSCLAFYFLESSVINQRQFN